MDFFKNIYKNMKPSKKSCYEGDNCVYEPTAAYKVSKPRANIHKNGTKSECGRNVRFFPNSTQSPINCGEENTLSERTKSSRKNINRISRSQRNAAQLTRTLRQINSNSDLVASDTDSFHQHQSDHLSEAGEQIKVLTDKVNYYKAKFHQACNYSDIYKQQLNEVYLASAENEYLLKKQIADMLRAHEESVLTIKSLKLKCNQQSTPTRSTSGISSCDSIEFEDDEEDDIVHAKLRAELNI
uniref:Uncharacterized protein n=1 Tax=Rhabditophanes sp. KR3021 TaxID=114890 RepID=A0AC35TPH5_9BILA